MTPAGWARCLKLWNEVWPNMPLPGASVETWFDLLADVDDEAALGALVAWSRDPERAWPPRSPGEIRGAVDPPRDDWTEALGRLTRAVRSYGRYERPDLDDPALDAYVESMGGWVSLCASFDPTNPTVRAQFRDHYSTVQRRERREAAAELTSGILPALTAGDE